MSTPELSTPSSSPPVMPSSTSRSRLTCRPDHEPGAGGHTAASAPKRLETPSAQSACLGKTLKVLGGNLHVLLHKQSGSEKCNLGREAGRVGGIAARTCSGSSERSSMWDEKRGSPAVAAGRRRRGEGIKRGPQEATMAAGSKRTVLGKVLLIGFQHAIHPRQQALGAVVCSASHGWPPWGSRLSWPPAAAVWCTGM